MKNKEAPVYGSKLYKDDSSICKAAIHNGAIDTKGGVAVFGIARG